MTVYEVRTALDQLVKANPAIDDLRVEIRHDESQQHIKAATHVRSIEYHPATGKVLLMVGPA